MIQRMFYPGEEWVYFKIYLSPVSVNNLLLFKLSPLINLWFKENIISSWFFIRYADPNFHLRVRVKISNLRNIGRVIIEMRNCLQDEISQSLINCIQIDTYQREIERYGEVTMEECEHFFQSDSEYVLDLINRTDEEDDLIINSIIWIYYFLLSVRMSDQSIADFAREMTHKYQNEFGFSLEQRKIINLKFRDLRLDIIKNIKEWDRESKKFFYFNERIKLANENNVLSSLIHMHINRLFKLNQRIYEYIIYHMLGKIMEFIIKNGIK